MGQGVGCTTGIFSASRKAFKLDDMQLPRSIIQSLLIRTIHFLTIGMTILLLGIVSVDASATNSQLAFTPSALRFGGIVVGQSETLLVTVANTGQTSATVSGIAVGNSEFTTSSLSLPLVLSAGQSVDLSVTFAPKTIGWTGSTIKFFGNASIANLNVGGSGENAEALTASPSIVSFGQVATGTTSTVPVVLTNARSWQVTLFSLQTSGSGFSISGPAVPLTLGVGQSVRLNVTFTPRSAGTVGGSLLVSGPALAIPLTGTGTAPAAPTAPGQLSANPASLSFGSAQVGSSVTLAGSLTNTGASGVTISQATATGTGFSISGLSVPLVLNPGASVPFSAVFAPQSAASVSGGITVVSNASNSTVNVSLSGTGTAPGQLTANPASLAFGSAQTGSSVTLTDSLTNTGGSSVTISQATATGTGFSISGLNAPLVLNPGASVTFSAVFAPQSAASLSGGIAVVSNASNSTLNVSLSGTGTAPGQLTLAPTALSFGNATVGTSVSQASSLSAAGASVTVSSASLSSAEFSLTGISLPVTIAAGQSVPVTMTFSPQTSGSASGVLSVGSNASNTATQSLSGVGVAPTQHSVSLSWTDTNSGISGYNVYRGNASGGPYTEINSGLDATTAYSDTSVVSGQTYYYVATAVNESGEESAYSNEAQGVVPNN